MDKSRGYVLSGEHETTTLWTHQVVVIIPKVVDFTNVSMAYLTGGCNQKPGEPHKMDEDVLVADEITSNSHAIGIVVFQIPNCPYVFTARIS